MKQCDRGHFYDDVRYQECPYCEKVQPTYGATISVSQVIEEPVAAATPIVEPVSEVETLAEPMGEVEAVVEVEPLAEPVAEVELVPEVEPQAEPVGEAEPVSEPVAEVEPVATPPAAEPLAEPAAEVEPASSAPQEFGATVGVFTSKVGIDPPVAFAVVISGPDRGASYTLQAGRSFIGRNPDSDIALPNDEAVSREGHALISYDARKNSFLVASGQGRQITYLNGEELIDPKPITAYDVIEVGNSKISFLPFCGKKFNWETV
jgi:predicted component of type VI protein secretion system